MTMKLSILLSANGKEAKAEVKAIESALAKMGTTAKASDGTAKSLTQSTKTLDAAVGQAKVEVQQLSAAQVRNAATAGRMSAANQAASGSIGNLTAQFNDIGVMLAAGQSPFQLAIQQGTQISQVLGPMGAAGAGKALLGGLKAMISPMSLLTIGTIAGGAALFQWATRTREADADAERFAESLEAINEQALDAATSVKLFYSGFPNADVLAVYTEISQKERELAAIRQEQEGQSGRNLRATKLRGDALQTEIDALQEQLSVRESNVATAERLERIQAQANRAGADYVKRIQAEKDAISDAQSLIAQLQDQAAIRAAITKHGEDSLQVAEARIAAERRVFVETTNSKDVSAELKQELTAAWDAANGVASVDMAGNISLATVEAEKLLATLNRFTSLNPITPAMQDEDAAFNQPVLSTSATRAGQQRAVSNFNRIIKPKSSGGGTNKVSETEREQKAIDDLIASLREQQDVIRTTDPVQKEMIQNRKVLANATKAEKATVEELISARLREEAAVSQATERADFYGNVLSSALDTATQSGAKLDDVLKNIAGSLIDATIQAAIFGSGPFGNIFGGVGIFGTPAAPQPLAAGGMIYGAGGGRDDKVPVMGSAGEFIVNAKATAANRNLLEAINAGAPIQALAKGGAIGGGSAPRSAGSGGGDVIQINVDVTGANGNTEIMQMVAEGVSMGIEQYDRHALPGRVSEISQNPRMVG